MNMTHNQCSGEENSKKRSNWPNRLNTRLSLLQSQLSPILDISWRYLRRPKLQVIHNAELHQQVKQVIMRSAVASTSIEPRMMVVMAMKIMMMLMCFLDIAKF